MPTALTTSVTSRDRKGRKLMNTVAAVYDKAELSEEAAQLLNERGDEFTAGLRQLIARYSTKAPDYKAARDFLGDDFVSPEEIVSSRPGVVYNPKQLHELGKTVPANEVLEWCRDNGFMLVAGPPRPMSLLDISELECDLYVKKDGWYKNEAFVRNDKATCCWLMLRKEPVPGSVGRMLWEEQQGFLSSFEVTPNVAEQVWGMTTYKAVRNIYLLPSVYVRTSGVDSRGVRCSVGFFDRFGLEIRGLYLPAPYEILGVSSRRK